MSGFASWEDLTVNNEQKRPPDVVSVAGLQDVLDSGWHLHVVCRKAPELRGYQWHGSWYLVAADPESDEWVVLVTARERQRAKNEMRSQSRSTKDIEFREIKTASGLISLLTEFGFRNVGVPTEEGSSVILAR